MADARASGPRSTGSPSGAGSGIGSELDGVAGALLRATNALCVALTDMESAAMRWMAAAIPAQARVVEAAAADLRGRNPRSTGRDPDTDSATETRIEGWLAGHGADDRMLIAALVVRDLDERWLETWAGQLPAGSRAPALALVGASMAARALVRDAAAEGHHLGGLAGRISGSGPTGPPATASATSRRRRGRPG